MSEWDDEFNHKAYLRLLGKRIAKVRRSKGYSQDRLSLEGGLSRGTLSKIEAGKVDPKATTLARIAEILGVPVGKLFEFRHKSTIDP